MTKSKQGPKTLYITYFTLLLATLAALLLVDKGDAVIFLNKWHNSGLDNAMFVTTKMGELFGFGLVVVLLFFRSKWRHVLAFLLTCTLMLGVIFFLKHEVFSSHMRPSVVLSGESLHFIEGLYIKKKFSFPSGHTTAAFTYFVFMALTLNKRGGVLALLLFAVLVGFSRIYLAQHFLQDVVAGSILGLLLASFGYYVVSEKWLIRFALLNAKAWGRAKSN
jgi:membrane-associated phospholipid phosphatase